MRPCLSLMWCMSMFFFPLSVSAGASDEVSSSGCGAGTTLSEGEGVVPCHVPEVGISSSVDSTIQRAMFVSTEAPTPRPLLVVLHSWSGSYTSADPLMAGAVAAGGNYIHPDFRGPNRHPDACLSAKALADIDDAIQYAIDRGRVDMDNIFVVGASGGGYATLGLYLKTRHPVRLFMAWVPISDLTSWYWQSKNRDNKYADDILLCVSRTGLYDEEEARARSPLYWEIPERAGARLEIFAGINDGYTGSVPVSHSILFFNKLADHFGRPEARVSDTELVKLLSRGIETVPNPQRMEGRAIVYSRDIPEASLTVFEGGHEILTSWCLERLRMLSSTDKK